MTSREGKAFLKNCFEDYQYNVDIEDLICYKTGTKVKAADYQKDEIQTDVDWSKEKTGIKFVVKCFIHLDLYVAWPEEVGRGTGKYIFYTKDLVAMERDQTCTFREIVIGNFGKAYVFRGEEGVKKFMKDYLMTNLG